MLILAILACLTTDAPSSITVTTDAELNAAMKDGEKVGTILLDPDGDFSAIKIRNSAIPLVLRTSGSGRKAVATELHITNSRTVVVSGIDFITPAHRPCSISVTGSSAIHIEDCEVSGSLNAENARESSQHIGISVRRGCSDINIANCVLSKCGTGVYVESARGVSLRSSLFEGDNIKDSISIANDVEVLLVEDCQFHAPETKVFDKSEHHYDFIQFWVDARATRNSENIVIQRNLFLDPSGLAKPQCIFGGPKNGVPFTITAIHVLHNRFVTQHANAIRLDRVHDLEIVGNVMMYAGDLSSAKPVDIPGISFSGSREVHCHSNVLPRKWLYSRLPPESFYANLLYDINLPQR